MGELLRKEHKVDICIVGGGLAVLSLQLRQQDTGQKSF